MGLEIERKFLVKDASWKGEAAGVSYRQGYLSRHRDRTVRVRTAGEQAYLTIKGRSRGAVRSEYEYGIPYGEALELLTELCEKPLIEKVRYRITYQGVVWEVDEFGGENRGLVVAEVELATEEQAIPLPPWVGAEVTTEAKYYNSSLIRNPYARW
ncbi:MAG: CYTH domain-containing protein [Ferruginibacter sp.]|nr:CYTH domain-containing protein [Cytophagales bacterium]